MKYDRQRADLFVSLCVYRGYGDMFTRGDIKPSFTSVSRVTGINEANHRRRRGGGRAKAMKTAAAVSGDRHPQIRMVNGSNPRGAINASVDHLTWITRPAEDRLPARASGGTLCARARVLYEILSRKVYQPRPFLLFNPLMRSFALHAKNVKAIRLNQINCESGLLSGS